MFSRPIDTDADGALLVIPPIRASREHQQPKAGMITIYPLTPSSNAFISKSDFA